MAAPHRAVMVIPGLPAGLSRRSSLMSSDRGSETQPVVAVPVPTTTAFAPLFIAGQPQAPPQLRGDLTAVQHHIDDRLASARLPMAA